MLDVKEELEHVRAYIDIQKLRYHDKISAEFEVGEAVLTYKMPKFILQPLIENSIDHGFGERERLNILIKASLDNDRFLFIEVIDDGIGITETELENIRKRLIDRTQSKHIGLVNVNERIQLFFGTQYAMEITSQVNKGTAVMLKLPVIKEL